MRLLQRSLVRGRIILTHTGAIMKPATQVDSSEQCSDNDNPGDGFPSGLTPEECGGERVIGHECADIGEQETNSAF